MSPQLGSHLGHSAPSFESTGLPRIAHQKPLPWTAAGTPEGSASAACPQAEQPFMLWNVGLLSGT